MQNKNNMYRTESLNVAAYLKSRGFQPERKEDYGRKASIYFESSKELYQAIEEYNNNDELKKFISAFREIKEFIRNN